MKKRNTRLIPEKRCPARATIGPSPAQNGRPGPRPKSCPAVDHESVWSHPDWPVAVHMAGQAVAARVRGLPVAVVTLGLLEFVDFGPLPEPDGRDDGRLRAYITAVFAGGAALAAAGCADEPGLARADRDLISDQLATVPGWGRDVAEDEWLERMATIHRAALLDVLVNWQQIERLARRLLARGRLTPGEIDRAVRGGTRRAV